MRTLREPRYLQSLERGLAILGRFLEWTRSDEQGSALVAGLRRDAVDGTNETAVSAGVSGGGRAAGARRPDRKRRSGEPGCSEQSLHNWVKQRRLDQRERQDGLTSAEREELRELRKRVRRVEMERDILKRAAVLFAAETETR